MDRLNGNDFRAEKQLPGKRLRAARLLWFVAFISAFLLFKSFHDGWLEPRLPLPLDGSPAVVLFTLGRGCECQMSVIRSAEAQVASWQVPAGRGIPVLRVDFGKRPDLAMQYGLVRAPALVLLDSAGQVVWKQDLGLSDEAPLDLDQAGRQLDTLLAFEGSK